MADTMDLDNPERLTAQQIKYLEDSGRRLSEAVWNACMNEGHTGYVAGLKVYEHPHFGNRDMSYAWRIGWFTAKDQASMFSEFSNETTAKPAKRSAKK